MDGNRASALLVSSAGFALGVAEALTRIAQVLIAMGTIGGFLGGAAGALLRKDVTAAAALGSGFGVLFGTILVLIDALIGG